MDTFNYITTDGDRIDLLAHRFYGSMQGVSIIADANPFVPMYPVYPLGTVLLIPLIDRIVKPINNLLPPWKRNLQ